MLADYAGSFLSRLRPVDPDHTAVITLRLRRNFLSQQQITRQQILRRLLRIADLIAKGGFAATGAARKIRRDIEKERQSDSRFVSGRLRKYRLL